MCAGMVSTMYCTPNFASDLKSSSADSKRKEARYELASLLTRKRFEDAVKLADTYLISEVIRREDHAFVIEIVFAAKSLSQESGG
jgi:hypothetical protein